MVMSRPRSIAAGEFKTHCLRVMDEVQQKRVTVIITKRGNRGAPQFTMQVRQGSNFIGDPEEYFPSTWYTCAGTSGDCVAGEVTEFNVLREDRIRNGNEWFQTGHAQGYVASVGGGTEGVARHDQADCEHQARNDHENDDGPHHALLPLTLARSTRWSPGRNVTSTSPTDSGDSARRAHPDVISEHVRGKGPGPRGQPPPARRRRRRRPTACSPPATGPAPTLR